MAEELVQFNPKIHLDDFRQLCIESFTWHWDEMWKNYQVDMVPSYGTPSEFVDRQLESYASLKPPEGILLILEVDGETAGMGAITKFNDDICEVRSFDLKKLPYESMEAWKERLKKIVTDSHAGLMEVLFDKVISKLDHLNINIEDVDKD